MRKYKILKLKSGEDIIGLVRLTKDGNVKIHRPMVFKTALSQDLFGGVKEYFMLKNWLVMSTDNFAILTKDSIMTVLTASLEITKLYDLEKIKEDVNPNKYRARVAEDNPKSTLPKLPDMPDMPETNSSLNDLKRYVEEMMQQVDKMDELDSNLKDVAKPQKGDKMVYMNMVFSPEVIVELLRSGILNRKEFGEIINHITNENGEGMNPQKFTGHKKDKKNLGNDWTDWNADPFSGDYK